MNRQLFTIGTIFLWATLALGAELSVMAYNVENLFDTDHDRAADGSDKEDWEFLPKGTPGKEAGCRANPDANRRKDCLATDWTPDKLELKLKQIKKVLSAVGKLPDVLTVSEVENEAVVKRLADTLGFTGFAMTDSPDRRGIDVALLYKDSPGFVFKGKRTLTVKSPKLVKPTRDLLEVTFEFEGNPIAFYVNHWPSQDAVTEVRLAVAETLAEWMAEARKNEPNLFQVVTGDLNTIGDDHPSPVYEAMIFGQQKLGLVDAWDAYRAAHDSLDEKKKYQLAMPPGTYFFPWSMQWNQLDRFLVPTAEEVKRRKLKLSWDVDAYQVFAPSFMRSTFTFNASHYLSGTRVTGVPFKYDHRASDEKTAGYSDHFPILGKIRAK